MKKLYAILSLAVSVLAMNASPLNPARVHDANMPKSKHIVLGKGKQFVSNSRADECIYEVEGTEVIKNRVSSGVIDGEFFSEYETPFIMVDGGDGKVYLKNPLSYVVAPGYVVAEKDDDGLHLQLPQPIYYDDENEIWYWLTRMELVDAEGLQYAPSADEDNSVDFDIYEDGTMELNLGNSPDDAVPSLILGVTYGYSLDDQYFFDGGDSYAFLEELQREIPTLPEGLEFETWNMYEPYYGNNDVNICVTDSKVYFQGVFIYSPNLWFAGDLKDGIIEIEPAFLGIDYESCAYALMALCTEDEEEEWEYISKLYLNYDAGAKKIYSDDYYCLLEYQPNGDIIDYIEMMVFQYVNYDNIDPVPADPTFGMIIPYSEEDELGAFFWNAPAENNDGVPLLNGEFYANLYLDGELLVMDAEQYGVEEPMTDIPYDWYAPSGLCMYMGGSLIWATTDSSFSEDTFKTLGCQVFYKVDGEVYASNLVTYNTATGESSGIADVQLELQSVKYYDLTGIEHAMPVKGIYVEVSTLSDGSRMVRKVCK